MTMSWMPNTRSKRKTAERLSPVSEQDQDSLAEHFGRYHLGCAAERGLAQHEWLGFFDCVDPCSPIAQLAQREQVVVERTAALRLGPRSIEVVVRIAGQHRDLERALDGF